MTGNTGHTVTHRKNISCLVRILLRSLSINASWNFSRMQNIGFAFSLIPFVTQPGIDARKGAAFLKRHLESFNTHPYLTGPILGAVVRLEKDAERSESCLESVNLKNALMAPYAALGDPFFWGALRPLAAITGIIMAFKGLLIAPLVVILIYNPVHLWIRLKGFWEGYRDGRGAINFLKMLRLPELSRRIRWISVILLAVMAAGMLTLPSIMWLSSGAEALAHVLVLVVIISCVWLIKRGASPLGILYGAFIIFLIIVA